MVRIINDPEHLVSQAGEQAISNISEYVGAYMRILATLQNNQTFRLVVQHQAVFLWLKNFSLRYPQGTFVFETLDARRAQRQYRGMEIPTSVTNEDFFKTRLFATTDIVESFLCERDLNGLLPVCG